MRRCKAEGCGNLVGVEHRRCPECRHSTTGYGPRYDRAQTVDGAKERYVDPDTDYMIEDFERDVERILAGSKNPDTPDRPTLEGHELIRP